MHHRSAYGKLSIVRTGTKKENPFSRPHGGRNAGCWPYPSPEDLVDGRALLEGALSDYLGTHFLHVQHEGIEGLLDVVSRLLGLLLRAVMLLLLWLVRLAAAAIAGRVPRGLAGRGPPAMAVEARHAVHQIAARAWPHGVALGVQLVVHGQRVPGKWKGHTALARAQLLQCCCTSLPRTPHRHCLSLFQ